MGIDFEALNEAGTGKLSAHTQAADFGPSDFQLPDLEGPPDPPSIQASQQSQQIQNLIARESLPSEAAKPVMSAKSKTAEASTETQNQSFITPQLQKELTQTQSDTRSEKLKAQIQGLKQLYQKLNQNPLPSPENKGQLLKSIALIKGCYTGETAPKDYESQSILKPLLKCQYMKWQALKDNQAITPPPPEEKILKKLRQQAGSLAPMERASLFQLVLLINKLLPFFAAPDKAHERPETVPSSTPQTPTKQSSTKQETNISLEDFAPLQASRLIMQIRSKLQRTRSPEEKNQLQQQLESLLKKQSLHRQQQQFQALQRNAKSLSLRLQSLQIKAESPRSLWAKIKEARQKTAQDCQFLYKQLKDVSVLWESALRQLARVGLEDAETVIQREQSQNQEWLQQSTLSQEFITLIELWWRSFSALIQQLQKLSLDYVGQAQLLESEKFLSELQTQQKQWQQQRDSIKQLEAAYLETEDSSQRSQIQKELWQKYAESLLSLPGLNPSS